ASLMRGEVSRLPGQFETLKSLETAVIDLINYGYPDDYYARFDRNIRSMSERALAEAAKEYIRPDDVIWLVVGDLKRVGRGIRELNLGEIIRLAAHGRPTE